MTGRAEPKMHTTTTTNRHHGVHFTADAPDNVSMAATAIAISAGGALSSLHTTVLLTVEETVAALQKAASIRYRPPGEKV